MILYFNICIVGKFVVCKLELLRNRWLYVIQFLSTVIKYCSRYAVHGNIKVSNVDLYR